MLQRERARTVFTVALLVAAFLLTAFMAVRAQRGALYHRVTAENVVRDWTRVAADELARRADAQGGFYGTYPVLQSMLANEPVTGRNARLVRCAFRYDGALQSECPPYADALRPELAKLLAAPPPPADRKPLHANGRTFVYAVARDGRSIAGFEVDRAQLALFFPLVLETRPLLPKSLAEGRIQNDAFRFRVVDADGKQIFATKERVESPLAVRVHPDEGGLLRGMTIDASIDPKVAPLLVFGGIPRPLPVYMITLALTSALLLTALFQFRRERALARLRSDFVAGVSHELRTPLTQIRMFAETLLLRRVRSEDEQQRALTIIDQESRRLTQLVENVLQFSRGERGTLRLRRERIDAAAIVRATIESFRPIAAARNVTLSGAAASQAAELTGDADAISQIVLNLLDNAVKYGPPGQEVQVSVERADNTVRIIVDDAGPGVPPRDRKRIWRRYERLPRDSKRAVAGAGIGLAVVRELALLHGGKAWTEESARGGACFIVELPA
jgi:signal transduction histidine kinase